MKMKRYKVNAYMTVEAALVMSVVLMVYLFIMRCMFFQYDRCLLEQESARLLVQCVAKGIDEREEALAVIEGLWDAEQYLWLDVHTPALQDGRGYLAIQTKGENAYMGSWQVEYKVWKTNPVGVLRAQRAIQRKQEEEKEK